MKYWRHGLALCELAAALPAWPLIALIGAAALDALIGLVAGGLLVALSLLWPRR